MKHALTRPILPQNRSPQSLILTSHHTRHFDSEGSKVREAELLSTAPLPVAASPVQLTLDPSKWVVFVLDHRWTDLMRIAHDHISWQHTMGARIFLNILLNRWKDC